LVGLMMEGGGKKERRATGSGKKKKLGFFRRNSAAWPLTKQSPIWNRKKKKSAPQRITRGKKGADWVYCNVQEGVAWVGRRCDTGKDRCGPPVTWEGKKLTCRDWDGAWKGAEDQKKGPWLDTRNWRQQHWLEREKGNGAPAKPPRKPAHPCDGLSQAMEKGKGVRDTAIWQNPCAKIRGLNTTTASDSQKGDACDLRFTNLRVGGGKRYQVVNHGHQTRKSDHTREKKKEQRKDHRKPLEIGRCYYDEPRRGSQNVSDSRGDEKGTRCRLSLGGGRVNRQKEKKREP